MSGYRSRYGGDERRRQGFQRGYYENLSHEPPSRPTAGQVLDRAVKTSNEKPAAQDDRGQSTEHDTREDERDDSRAHREREESSNARSFQRAAPVSLSAPSEPYSPYRTGNMADQASLQFLARRGANWEYENWLNSTSQYPAGVGRGRPRPPRIRASYPFAASVSLPHPLLDRVRQNRGVRDFETYEGMRSRISESVRGDASASLGLPPLKKGPLDYSASTVVRRRPILDADGPVRNDISRRQAAAFYRDRVSHAELIRQGKRSNPVVGAVKVGQKPVEESSPVRGEKRSSIESTNDTDSHEASAKRHKQNPSPPQSVAKPDTGTSMLDLLCTATLEVGPLKDTTPTGCSCSKSHCIKLYCECFKARRHCTDVCACANCKNTVAESGADGELTKAIHATLIRNPHAFSQTKKEISQPNPGGLVCRCVKSRCLKLYCDCFQGGMVCGPACSCVACLNTTEESGAGRMRAMAIRQCLEKRPDAFEKKVKKVGSGCACKNNRCLKKYCDCFRFGLSCSDKCSCKNCENLPTSKPPEEIAALSIEQV